MGQNNCTFNAVSSIKFLKVNISTKKYLKLQYPFKTIKMYT